MAYIHKQLLQYTYSEHAVPDNFTCVSMNNGSILVSLSADMGIICTIIVNYVYIICSYASLYLISEQNFCHYLPTPYLPT